MPGRRSARVALTLATLTVWLAACRSSPASLAPGDADNPIAPEFKAFWEEAGGLATFGPPLEPSHRQGGILRQTFLAVQLAHDDADRDRPVRLASLGLELGLSEPAQPPTDGQSGRYFPQTGHTLYAGFAPYFDALGGLDVVGPPITEVQFRSGRITQYFENLGMVRPENASPSDVRLVALGLAALPGSAFGLDVDSVILPGTVRQRPFADALEDYGGESVLGQPLGDPYMAADGMLEQVYERAVVYGDESDSRKVGFRPIGREFGPTAPPTLRADEPGGIFDESTGHNILWAFADFYRSRQGVALLGAPLEEARLEGDRLVQWFENGELLYNYDMPADLAIELAPLGSTFQRAHPAPLPSATGSPQPTSTEAATPLSTGDLVVQVTLEHPLLRASDVQTVHIVLLDRAGAPLPDVRPSVVWYGPASSESKQAPPTDEDGQTSIAFELESAQPFEIFTVVVSAGVDGQRGSALVQFAVGWSPFH